RARECETATDDFERAEEEFRKVGGFNGTPRNQLVHYLGQLEKSFIRDVPMALGWLKKQWVFGIGRDDVQKHEDIKDGLAAEFVEEAMYLLKEKFGRKFEVELLDESVIEDRGFEVDGRHCFLRVGNEYYDADQTNGTNDPLKLPY